MNDYPQLSLGGISSVMGWRAASSSRTEGSLILYFPLPVLGPLISPVGSGVSDDNFYANIAITNNSSSFTLGFIIYFSDISVNNSSIDNYHLQI